MARVDVKRDEDDANMWKAIAEGAGLECVVRDGVRTAEYKLAGDKDEDKYVIKILVPAKRSDEGRAALQRLAKRIKPPVALCGGPAGDVGEPDEEADAAD